MTDDLAVWLLACLEDDRQVALVATSCTENGRYDALVWTVEDNEVTGDDGTEGGMLVARARWDDPGILAHIARWDPARVLADIDAKQRIVAEHANGWQGWEDPPTADDIEHAYCVRCEDEHHPMRWPCTTLKLLALPYQDRPGYQDTWHP